MAANPNSNLVFDFPDPSPRFEFGDSYFAGNKNNRRGGKGLGKSKKLGKAGKFGFGIRSGKNSNGPSKLSSGTGTGTGTGTTSPAGTSNFGDDFFATDFGDFGGLGLGGGKASHNPPRKNSSPLKSRNNSGDIAAGPLARGGGSDQQFAPPHFDLSPPDPPPGGKASPHRPRPEHSRNTSSASSTGFISDVSEFSFDRVTVTTNGSGRTNQSSHLSWNFLDDSVLDALGGGQDAFVSHTGDAGVPPNEGGKKKRAGHHRKNKSTSTFSNVSLSSVEESDDIPFTGVIKDGETQSIVSEISDRVEHVLLDRGANDAVNALLREGMESARRREKEEKRAISMPKVTPNKGEGMVEMKDRGGDAGGMAKIRVCKGDSSPSRNTLCTASTANSTASEGSTPAKKVLFLDMRDTYAKFKMDRNRGKQFSVLRSIIEDVQFCGLYICGIVPARNDAVDGDIDGRGGDDSVKRSRDKRKRESDNTFLGRVIQCGNDLGCVSL